MAMPADERILAMARRQRGVTAREIEAEGLHRQTLTRLVRAGRLDRIARGVYRHPDAAIGDHHGLVLASLAAPSGAVCLLSALAFHGIGTQLPSQVWMAVDRRSRPPPRAGFPPLRVVYFGGPAFSEGVEIHRLEHRPVRIYGVAKTLADCFKYRNKVGLDVAMEALREAWRTKRFTLDEIDAYARICRVERVMRPYLEALAA